VARGDARTYADLITPAGLAEIAGYAHAIGPSKSLVIPRRADDRLAAPTALVTDAHELGLEVHPWTFRAENAFLPAEFRRGTAPGERGDLAGELRAYLACGIDGFFTDQTDVGVAVRNAFVAEARP
jgi:glycerophosphoryl diester phosphodiesterase